MKHSRFYSNELDFLLELSLFRFEILVYILENSWNNFGRNYLLIKAFSQFQTLSSTKYYSHARSLFAFLNSRNSTLNIFLAWLLFKVPRFSSINCRFRIIHIVKMFLMSLNYLRKTSAFDFRAHTELLLAIFHIEIKMLLYKLFSQLYFSVLI